MIYCASLTDSKTKHCIYIYRIPISIERHYADMQIRMYDPFVGFVGSHRGYTQEKRSECPCCYYNIILTRKSRYLCGMYLCLHQNVNYFLCAIMSVFIATHDYEQAWIYFVATCPNISSIHTCNQFAVVPCHFLAKVF